MELWGCLFCLISDSASCFFHGMGENIAYYGVRVSNCCTFIFTAVILALFVRYLEIILGNKQDVFKQWAFRIVYDLCIVDIVLVVVSQFADIYYYFDEQNVYHRGQWFWLLQKNLCKTAFQFPEDEKIISSNVRRSQV